MTPQVDDDAGACVRDARHGEIELGTAVAAQRSEDVAGQALGVHADEDLVPLRRFAEHERDMVALVHVRPVADGTPLAVGRGDDGLDDALDDRLGATPVRDQVGDGDDEQAVLLGEALEVGSPLHRAVCVHELGDHAAVATSREAREVDGRLGVSGPAQHPARLVAQREHVTGTADVRGARLTVRQDLDGPRTVGRRDARAHALPCVDRHRVRRSLRILVAHDHHRDLEALEVLAEHRDADDPARVVHHEGKRSRVRRVRRHHEVALVLTLIIVDDDDHAAGRDDRDRLIDAREAHACARCGSMRSTYFATTSTSRLTLLLGSRSPRFVQASV